MRWGLVLAIGVSVASAACVVTPTSTTRPATPALTTDPCRPVAEVSPAPMPRSSSSTIDQATAEQIAVDLFRSCEQGATITELIASETQGPGHGPNAGRRVWYVRVSARIAPPTNPGQVYDAHFVIEVDPATGIPTVTGQG